MYEYSMVFKRFEIIIVIIIIIILIIKIVIIINFFPCI